MKGCEDSFVLPLKLSLSKIHDSIVLFLFSQVIHNKDCAYGMEIHLSTSLISSFGNRCTDISRRTRRLFTAQFFFCLARTSLSRHVIPLFRFHSSIAIFSAEKETLFDILFSSSDPDNSDNHPLQITCASHVIALNQLHRVLKFMIFFFN